MGFLNRGAKRPNTGISRSAFRTITVKDAEKEEKDTLIATYMHLTKDVLPSLAKSDRRGWPVSEVHCFQRIALPPNKIKRQVILENQKKNARRKMIEIRKIKS